MNAYRAALKPTTEEDLAAVYASLGIKYIPNAERSPATEEEREKIEAMEVHELTPRDFGARKICKAVNTVWMYNKNWTADNLELFRKMWDEGKSHKEIGENFGVSRNYISIKARSLGLSDRRGTWYSDNAAEFERMWMDGVPTSEMAKHFGVIKGTISKKARELDLPRRK